MRKLFYTLIRPVDFSATERNITEVKVASVHAQLNLIKFSMKNFLTILALGVVMTAHAQTRVVKDSTGNYKLVSHRDTSSGKATGQYLTDKDGVKHPVLVSARGKLYYMRTSKAGNVYKCYIKVDQN